MFVQVSRGNSRLLQPAYPNPVLDGHELYVTFVFMKQINFIIFSMFLNFQELSHQKVYIAPLQDETISTSVPSKADGYEVCCIYCNVQIYSSEIEVHKASCRQSSEIEPTENEIEEGKRLLDELIQREMGASEAKYIQKCI